MYLLRMCIRLKEKLNTQKASRHSPLHGQKSVNIPVLRRKSVPLKRPELVWMVQGQPKAVLNPPQTEGGPIPDLVRLDAAPLWEVCTFMQPFPVAVD